MRSKPCAFCKQPVEVPELTGWAKHLNGLDACCDACVQRATERKRREEQREDCKRRYFDLLNRKLLQPHFREASFARSREDVEAQNPEAWKSAREWALRDNLYIHGHIGTGKTFLALCCLRKPFVAGYDVAETTARQFVRTSDLFRDPWNLMESWKAVDVLLLDDFDKATWNLDRIDALWELLNARMSAGRRTIMTGNVSLHDMNVMMRESAAANTARADAALERLKPIQQIEMKGKSLR